MITKFENRYVLKFYVIVCSELSDMAEAYELHPSYNLPHNDRLTPHTVLAFGG